MIIAGVAVAFFLSEVVRNVGGVLNHNTLDGETHVIWNAYVCVCWFSVFRVKNDRFAS